MKTLESIKKLAAAFVEERDWRQFQSPKNLVMALSVEVAELMEHFQWLNEDESKNLDEKKREQVSDELADVLLYLVRMADELSIDLSEAVKIKAEKNALKYPIDKVKSSAKKYTEYND